MTKILIERSTVEQALEALEEFCEHQTMLRPIEKRESLKAALAEPQEPVQEPWEHLKQYGYAPGSYMSKCHICDKIASGVDKRAITCRPCAEARHAALEETVQEPFALPCPTPKACKAHCCSGHCVPRTNHLNHMTRIPPMLCITHRIPDCPKCMSTHTTPPQRPAEPVQEPVQEPVAWMYTGIKQDGTEHGPHLVWRPEYMDSMSASKGAKATPLYTAPPQRKPLVDPAEYDDAGAAERYNRGLK